MNVQLSSLFLFILMVFAPKLYAMETGIVQPTEVQEASAQSAALKVNKAISSLLEKSQDALVKYLTDNQDDVLQFMHEQITALNLPAPTSIQEAFEQLNQIDSACTLSLDQNKTGINFSSVHLNNKQIPLIQFPILQNEMQKLAATLYEKNITFKNICDYIRASLHPKTLDFFKEGLANLPIAIEKFLQQRLTSKKHYISLGHINTNSVQALVLTRDGEQIISGSNDKTIRIWDIKTGICMQTLSGHTDCVRCLVLTPDGTQIISGSIDNTIRVWDIKTGTCMQTLSGHTNSVMCLVMTPDGIQIISASADKTIRIWDIKTGTCMQTLSGHTDWVRCLVLTPDGTQIISGSDDKTIRVWDIKTGTCMQTLSGHTYWISYLVLTPDGEQIISGSLDKTIRVWDRKTGTCVQTLSGHTDCVRCLLLTPDGEKIISGSNDETIRVWDRKSGTCVQTLSGHTAWINCLLLTPDGNQIISGSDDHTIRLWKKLSFNALLAYAALKNIQPTQNFADTLDVQVLKNTNVFKNLSDDEQEVLHKKIQKFIAKKQIRASRKE